MNEEKIKKLIALAKEEGLIEFKYESDDEKFSFRLPSHEAPPVVYSPAPPIAQALPGQPIAVSSKDNSSDYLEVKSPFVGTFYRASSPDSAPFVKVGEKVSPGQVLCIVEAMKIMNEIEGEVSGEIVEVCVENETYVEFGQVLFKVKP